jgi:phage FluMu protein Com
MSESREYPCPKCGAFLVKTSATTGWIRAICRKCKEARTIYPKQEALRHRVA